MGILFNNGRVLKIKAGYNPNSSSIGTNLTPLILAGSVMALAIPVVSFIAGHWLKWIFKKDGQPQEPSP